ncbi:proclotting enzyme-like [Aricia agestis]|uniref:proclotting enzyme-like n=1 Tax=Aricia agestis TaxID=91739 RepID=UPI001C20530E|nr:proclotting enzyme-like [Aricia agestis]
MLGYKLIVCFLLFASTSVAEEDKGLGNGTWFTDDAVYIDALVSRKKRAANVARGGKQLLLFRLNDAAESDCQTSLGRRGKCKSFRDCYPLFKMVDFANYPGWGMGQYDGCKYTNSDKLEVFGVCCTEPVGTPPQQELDLQRFGLLNPALPISSPVLPYAGSSNNLMPAWMSSWNTNQRQFISQWPPTQPPLPTHPPNHTPATHPPNLVGYPTAPTTPQTDTVSQSTTWGTKPPSPSTTKQTWPPAYPTQPTRPTAQPTRPPAQPGTDSSCGIKNGALPYGSTEDEQRIVGGHNAELNEWPWIVGLFNNGRQFCGGSLIDDRHILSAAHCVAHMTSWDVARLTARLGDHDIRSNFETQHIERKIKRVVRHRNFDMRILYNDVAILTLDQPVTFSKTIRPVCLPTGGSRAYTGRDATVIGWGSLRESGPQPSILQEVTIPIWSNQECRAKYGSAAPGGIVDHMLCAGKASMDSCSGDSGGPLMVNEGGRWIQVGVVSWGIGCGKGQYPGVYTRVTSFLPWIQKNSK